MTSVLALIPARGGSKGVPRKAVRPLAGKPLIGWTIEAALACPDLERVVVTTEDTEIMAVSREFGAEVPFRRPAELAGDTTPGIEPVVHALDWLAQHEGYRPDWVLLLQPTSPLRTAGDISAAVALAGARDADSVVGVTEADPHPLWTKALDDDGLLREWLPDDGGHTRRQDLPPLVALNGAIYLTRRDVLLARRSWYGDRTAAYVMPPERSLDIDTPWDFHLAELVMSQPLGGEAE